MSHDPSIEQIISNLDRLLEKAPNKGDQAVESEPPENTTSDALLPLEQKIEEFEFVEDEDLAAAARQIKEEIIDDSESCEGEQRRILLTPDMQLDDGQVPLLGAEEMPQLPQQGQLTEEAIEEALTYEVVTDAVMEAEAAQEEEESVEEATLDDEQTTVGETAEEEVAPLESALEELLALRLNQERPATIGARALAEQVCEDVLDQLRVILPGMIAASVERALEDQSTDGDNDARKDGYSE